MDRTSLANATYPGLLQTGFREFLFWLKRLFRQPLFLFVTVWGHLAIFAGAVAFHAFESPVNPAPHGLFSAYYWAVSTAVTVGSADVQPVTLGGKIVAIFMMTIGSLFLWSYTALFAASLVSPVVRSVRREVEEIEGDMDKLNRDVKVDQALLERLIAELELARRERDGKA